MGLVVKTAPAAEPVSVEELRLHAVLDEEANTSYLESLLAAARARAETILGRQLITATYYWYLDAFPTVFYVPRPPLQSVVRISYAISASSVQPYEAAAELLDSDIYVVDAVSVPGRIVRAYGYTWPTPYSRPNTVVVKFKTGYGDAAANVPEDIRQAIKLLASWWYEQREDVLASGSPTRIPNGVNDLLLSYRATDMACAQDY